MKKLVFLHLQQEELVKDENLLKPKTDTVTVKAKQNNNTTGGGNTGGNAGGNTTPTRTKIHISK